MLSSSYRFIRRQFHRKLCTAANAKGGNVKHAELKAFLLGAFGGGLGSMIGIGGAFIVIPFLNGPMQLSTHMTHGTSVACVVATSISACTNLAFKTFRKSEDGASATNTHQEDDASIDVIAAVLVSLSAAFAAKRGAMMNQRMTSRQIKFGLGLFMLAVSPLVHLKEHLKQKDNERVSVSTPVPISLPNAAAVPSPVIVATGDGNEAAAVDIKIGLGEELRNNNLSLSMSVTRALDKIKSSLPETSTNEGTIGTMVGVGLTSGFVAGLFGVGGGAVTVPALALLTDMPYRTAILTSLAGKFSVLDTSALTLHFYFYTCLILCFRCITCYV